VSPLDEVKLLSVASSISDGSRIDWSAMEDPRADPLTSSVMAQLALVERVASFHRTTDPMPHGAKPVEPGQPETWGHFKILERVGRGTFGAVYRALDLTLQSEVALKLLPVSIDANRDDRLKEARLLARVRHPNVVTVHGADCFDGSVGIWMDLVAGRTLATLLRERGPLGAREAALVGLDLCRALAAVHGLGLLHGDIKAHNVMRETGGRTVLMDFGTGKDLVAAHEPGAPDFAGTPAYLAPEVFARQPRTKLTDIYSLGVLLYHLVTDAYPVDGRNREEIEERHRRRERTYLRDLRPDLPVEFIAIVERALAYDPRERYQTAGAFEADLARFSGASPEQVRPKRRPILAIGGAAAGLALAALIGYWGFLRPQTPAPAATPTATADSTYQIDVTLYRAGGADERLRPGARVGPGDRLFARVRVSVPAFVYIVNEDDQGDANLLFPLPGLSVTNPVSAGATNRIPGTADDPELSWQVTSVGGREHFFIFASPERLQAFEQMFAALPQATIGKPVLNARVSKETIGRLRSVGGLAPGPGRSSTSFLGLPLATPLGENEESARGLWVRQFTVENPAKKQ
jgi:hypothetical protein